MPNPKSFICSLSLIVMASLGVSCAHAPRHSACGDVEGTSALNQAKACLSAGNYKKALDIYAVAYTGHPKDEGLLDAYTDALESINAEADKAYEDQDYAKAGELYNTLLKSGFEKRHFQGEISFDDDYLAMRIGACSKRLIELGIQKYREGELRQAIAIWKKVLVFNPA